MSTGTRTLLDIVQETLTSMKSEEVNSIHDTEESTAIAYVVKDTYEFMLASMDSVDYKKLFELDAGGSTKPTMMYIPSNAEKVEWVKYNTRFANTDPYPAFTDIPLVTLEEFLKVTYELPGTADADIGTFTHITNGSSIEFYFNRSRHPTICTLIDNNTIVFDAYNSTLESNLLNQYSLCFGTVSTAFVMEDTFVIPFNRLNSQLLFQEVKAQAFLEFKQVENPKAEKRARHLKIHSQKVTDREEEFYSYGRSFDKLPNYGRKRS